MVDVRNKRKYTAKILKAMIKMEKSFAKDIAPIIKKQMEEVADHVEHGITRDFDLVIDKNRPKLIQEFRKNYLKAGSYFFSLVADQLRNKKGMERKEDEDIVRRSFIRSFDQWLKIYAAEQVVKINRTSKDLLKKIISKGVSDGKAYYEISRDIREVVGDSNFRRAMTIARTEIHTATNKATFESVSEFGVKIESKEWSSILDDRTRISHIEANGEVVPNDEFFMKTGEPLMYPGDPSGSPENIINCRCVVLYNT